MCAALCVRRTIALSLCIYLIVRVEVRMSVNLRSKWATESEQKLVLIYSNRRIRYSHLIVNLAVQIFALPISPTTCADCVSQMITFTEDQDNLTLSCFPSKAI